MTTENWLSEAKEHELLDQALMTLAWSERAYCVHRHGVNAVCEACAFDCECGVCDRNAVQLPEFIDGLIITWDEKGRGELLEQIKEFFSTPEVVADLESTGMSPEAAAHDFILTRNGHGAGFWDRGYGDAGRRLTDAVKTYGEVHATVLSAFMDEGPDIYATVGIEV